MPSKSYWMGACVDGKNSQEAVKSWFGSLADGLTAYKAEILCDVATDREKKIRAFMTDADNKHFRLERTLGGKTFSITRKPIASAVGSHDRLPATGESK